MIEKILNMDNLINNFEKKNKDYIDRIIFYIFTTKSDKLQSNDRERVLNTIINNLYDKILENSEALKKYNCDHFISIECRYLYDCMFDSVKNNDFLNEEDKEIILKLLLLQNIILNICVEKYKMGSRNDVNDELLRRSESTSIFSSFEMFNDVFKKILNKSNNPLKIISFLYNDFYYTYNNGDREVHFKSDVLSFLSSIFILKNPKIIKKELINNEKYKLMVSFFIEEFKFNNFSPLSLSSKIYNENEKNFSNVISDEELATRHINYRFQPDDSERGFNFGSYRALISINYNGNKSIYGNEDHYHLVHKAYKLFAQNAYFDTLLFEASRGNITIITEGSSAMVYLPMSITAEQFKSMKDLLDNYGTTDLNSDFYVCRVLVDNNDTNLYEYNGEKIPTEYLNSESSIRYNDFLERASNLINENIKHKK